MLVDVVYNPPIEIIKEFAGSLMVKIPYHIRVVEWRDDGSIVVESATDWKALEIIQSLEKFLLTNAG